MHSDLKYLLALNAAFSFHKRKLQKLQSQVSLKQLFHLKRADLGQLALSNGQVDYLLSPDWRGVEKALAWSENNQHHLVTIFDDDYPPLLKEISDAPLVLFVMGDPQILLQPSLAIVGSRKPTSAGAGLAKLFAKHMTQAGLVVVSGLAKGIDAAAHLGALEAAGLTIAVLAHGLDQIYPKQHGKLAEHIVAKGGALVSEYLPGVLPLAAQFPRRNRIISGLSLGTLVVEAKRKSGSLISAKHALSHNREVFAMPGSILNPESWGCHDLIQQGAKLVQQPQDILVELPIEPTGYLGEDVGLITPNMQKKLEKPLAKLLECVGFEATPIGLIMQRLGVNQIADVASALAELEIKGYIKQVCGGYVKVYQ